MHSKIRYKIICMGKAISMLIIVCDCLTFLVYSRDIGYVTGIDSIRACSWKKPKCGVNLLRCFKARVWLWFGLLFLLLLLFVCLKYRYLLQKEHFFLANYLDVHSLKVSLALIFINQWMSNFHLYDSVFSRFDPLINFFFKSQKYLSHVTEHHSSVTNDSKNIITKSDEWENGKKVINISHRLLWESADRFDKVKPNLTTGFR